MKQTRILFLSLVALLFIPGVSRAQQTLTVYDGTATSQYSPAYIYWWNVYTRSQHIIPATDLAAMNGHTISALTYYTSGENVPYTSESVCDVYLKEVPTTTLSAYVDKSTATVVYSGTVSIVATATGGTMTITFTTPYAYNGGNLLIGIENTTDVDGEDISFYGQNVSYTCGGSDNGWSLDELTFWGDHFIPKTTFTYSSGSSSLPDGVVIGDPNSSETSFSVPVSPYFNYSLTETIIDASEISCSMAIGSISYKYAGDSPMSNATCGIKIWLKPTTKTTFADYTDMEPVDSTAVLVYDGPFACSQGWNEVTFTTPYNYSGTGNLMVIVCDTVDGYDGMNYTFYTSNCTGNKTLAWLSDNYIPDPTSTSYSGGKSTLAYRSLMVLGEALAPLTVTISGPSTGAATDWLTFTATGPDDVTYNWEVDDPYKVEEYPDGYITEIKWLVAGTYKVRVTATRGSESVSDSMMVTISRRDPETAISSTAQWFAASAYGAHKGNFIQFTMQHPEQVQVISDDSFEYAFAAEYADGNVYIYYNNTGDLSKLVFNEANPYITNLTSVGTVSNPIMDMSYNIVDNTMYGIIIMNDHDHQLASIDLTTGNLTLIGAFLPQMLQTFAINAAGEAYGIAFDGNLYRVNLTNGSLTEIGPTGVAVNYLQSMSFDRATGELFWARYANADDFGLYKVNTTTGHADFIGYCGNHTIELCGLFNTSLPEPNGVNTSNGATSFILYPNPATDVVNVCAEALREVSLLDLGGRVLSTTASARVDVSGLAAGVYFLRVVTADGVATEKIVKE